jgi:hypothetical protein
VGQGRGVHGGQQQQHLLAVVAVAIHEAQGMIYSVSGLRSRSGPGFLYGSACSNIIQLLYMDPSVSLIIRFIMFLASLFVLNRCI